MSKNKVTFNLKTFQESTSVRRWSGNEYQKRFYSFSLDGYIPEIRGTHYLNGIRMI